MVSRNIVLLNLGTKHINYSDARQIEGRGPQMARKRLKLARERFTGNA